MRLILATALCAILPFAVLPTSAALAQSPSTTPYTIQFPQDLYDHPAFGGEWWYFTGNLTSLSGKPYGYELTFFRSILPTGLPAGQLQFVPVINADLAVSDLNGKRFSFQKIAAPQYAPYASINENPWTIQAGAWTLTEPSQVSYPYFLNAQQGEFGVELALIPEGAPVLNGDAGDGLFVLDAAGQGPQSYEYYSTPRMFTLGLIRIAGELIPVDGLSWNDHEFFNMPAGETFPSWDWFSIQLDDGASIMLYGLRLADGSYDPDSRGTFIAKDGTATWTSPNSGATYPIEWQISIPSLAVNLHMTTPLANQEMLQSNPFDTPTYWEGASRFTGTRNGQPVTGKGYLEMLGYAPVSPTLLIHHGID